jgi:hypothetical protein
MPHGASGSSRERSSGARQLSAIPAYNGHHDFQPVAGGFFILHCAFLAGITGRGAVRSSAWGAWSLVSGMDLGTGTDWIQVLKKRVQDFMRGPAMQADIKCRGFSVGL